MFLGAPLTVTTIVLLFPPSIGVPWAKLIRFTKGSFCTSLQLLS